MSKITVEDTVAAFEFESATHSRVVGPGNAVALLVCLQHGGGYASSLGLQGDAHGIVAGKLEFCFVGTAHGGERIEISVTGHIDGGICEAVRVIPKLAAEAYDQPLSGAVEIAVHTCFLQLIAVFAQSSVFGADAYTDSPGATRTTKPDGAVVDTFTLHREAK